MKKSDTDPPPPRGRTGPRALVSEELSSDTFSRNSTTGRAFIREPHDLESLLDVGDDSAVSEAERAAFELLNATRAAMPANDGERPVKITLHIEVDVPEHDGDPREALAAAVRNLSEHSRGNTVEYAEGANEGALLDALLAAVEAP